jgi:hypothetical protein
VIDISNVVFPPKFFIGKTFEWTVRGKPRKIEIEHNSDYDDPLRVGGRGLLETIVKLNTFPKFEKTA